VAFGDEADEVGGGGAGDASYVVDEAHGGGADMRWEEIAGDDGEAGEVAGAEKADDGADDE